MKKSMIILISVLVLALLGACGSRPAEETTAGQETTPAEETTAGQETAPAEESTAGQETAPAGENGEDMLEFQSIKLTIFGMMAQHEVYYVEKTDDGVHLSYYTAYNQWDEEASDSVEVKEVIHETEGGRELYREIAQLAAAVKLKKWDGFNESASDVLDGGGFGLDAELADGSHINAYGSNAYPENYGTFKHRLDELCATSSIAEPLYYETEDFSFAIPESWAGNVTAVYRQGFTMFEFPCGEEKIFFMGLDVYPYETDEENSVLLGTFEKDGITNYVWLSKESLSDSAYQKLSREQQAVYDASEEDLQKIAESFSLK